MQPASFVWIENALNSKVCAATIAFKGEPLECVAALVHPFDGAVGIMIAEINTTIGAVVVGLSCLAAGQDVMTRTIDDRFSIAIVAIFIVGSIVGLMAGAVPGKALAWALAIGLTTFCIGLGVFAAGLLGGGDVKMLSALAPWVDPNQGLKFLLVVTLAGGLVATLTLVFSWLSRKTAAKQSFMNDFFTSLGNDRDTVPFGVAIAVGTGAMWLTGGLGLPGVSSHAG
jgi:prepilin peptidase CpaA